MVGMQSFLPFGGWMLKFTPRGQGLVEYAMVILLVGIAVIITLSIFGTGVGNMFSQIVSGI